MPQKAYHYYISGQVQGVWYRASTKEKATQLGLTGWVKNLKDGRVEVYAHGEASILEDFEKWLWQGPQLAKVNNVVKEETNFETLSKFQVL